jgi:hypothetical protein
VAAPIVIVGGLSGFQAGRSSTLTQRGVLMGWLGVGQVFGLVMAMNILRSNTSSQKTFYRIYWSFFGGLSRRHLITPELLKRLDLGDRTSGIQLVDKFLMLKNYVMAQFASFFKFAMTFASPEAMGKFSILMSAIVWGFPAFWGFVIIAEMLLDYGNCIRIY